MSIGFYDYDLLLKPSKVVMNLEAMKIANYYHRQGEIVTLENSLDNINSYDKFYICRNLMAKKVPVGKDIISTSADNTTHIGLAYTNGMYLPMERSLEEQVPSVALYAPYIRQKVLENKITVSEADNLLHSNYIRLRAGSYEMDITRLQPQSKAFVYDYEIEKVTDWEDKLKYIRDSLTKKKITRTVVVNGFRFTSFENIEKLSKIPGFASMDAHLFSSDTYNEFKEKFNTIAPWVSSRDGIKYYYGHDLNPNNNTEVVKSLCLSINKYFYALSIGKACEFIVDDNCEVSPLNKIQKDFQYWTGIRVGDKTIKDYLMSRSPKTFDEFYKIIASTPYKSQFDSICNKTKNSVKQMGWYYHV